MAQRPYNLKYFRSTSPLGQSLLNGHRADPELMQLSGSKTPHLCALLIFAAT
jgi:hypothetical protein